MLGKKVFHENKALKKNAFFCMCSQIGLEDLEKEIPPQSEQPNLIYSLSRLVSQSAKVKGLKFLIPTFVYYMHLIPNACVVGI